MSVRIQIQYFFKVYFMNPDPASTGTFNTGPNPRQNDTDPDLGINDIDPDPGQNDMDPDPGINDIDPDPRQNDTDLDLGINDIYPDPDIVTITGTSKV